jgi:hypothetical protein
MQARLGVKHTELGLPYQSDDDLTVGYACKIKRIMNHAFLKRTEVIYLELRAGCCPQTQLVRRL